LHNFRRAVFGGFRCSSTLILRSKSSIKRHLWSKIPCTPGNSARARISKSVEKSPPEIPKKGRNIHYSSVNSVFSGKNPRKSPGHPAEISKIGRNIHFCCVKRCFFGHFSPKTGEFPPGIPGNSREIWNFFPAAG
jgi:hypothetical protein